MSMRVVVDDREREPRVAEALRGVPGVEVVVRRLKLGDYEVDGRLLVERKTAADLALSVVDTRLFRQAHVLALRADRRALLVVEGKLGDEGAAGVRPEALRGALVTVALVFGVPVIGTDTPEETGAVILSAARQLAQRGYAPPRRGGRRARGLRRAQQLLLQSIPGVGPARAATLLERFGAPAGVTAASEDEMAALEGFGRATAARVWSVLHHVECSEG